MARKQAAGPSNSHMKSKSSASISSKSSSATLAVQSVVGLISLSLSIFTAQIALTPLFGSVATNRHLEKISGALFASLFLVPSVRIPGVPTIVLLGASICVAPTAFHWISIWSAPLTQDAVAGSVLAYFPPLSFLTYLTTIIVRDFICSFLISSDTFRRLKPLIGLAISSAVPRSQEIWASIPFSRVLSPPMMLLASGWLCAALGALPSTSLHQARPSAGLCFALVLVVTGISLSLPPTLPRTLPYTHPSGLLRILSSEPSVTGRIVVAEDYRHGFRFLRADHSLLGGVWIGEKAVKMDKSYPFVRDKQGTKLGDSIYSTFVLQEAARLQEKEEPQKNALIIGLGAGIAAQAFMQHGLSTTIVEIDPAVYSAARNFFGVPQPATAYIEDARGWVKNRAALGNETYDIVVHDCFSGGGVPAHLFTTEFWDDLKKIINPDGIVAVNYAGVIGSDPSKAVLITLQKSFPQCRAFHDLSSDLTEEQIASEFINIVSFCTPSTKPLTFRRATKPDYLSSYLREHVLHALPRREVNLDLIRKDITLKNEADWILTDQRNPLGPWQDHGALDHWKVMRNILPGYVWETY